MFTVDEDPDFHRAVKGHVPQIIRGSHGQSARVETLLVPLNKNAPLGRFARDILSRVPCDRLRPVVLTAIPAEIARLPYSGVCAVPATLMRPMAFSPENVTFGIWPNAFEVPENRASRRSTGQPIQLPSGHSREFRIVIVLFPSR